MPLPKNLNTLHIITKKELDKWDPTHTFNMDQPYSKYSEALFKGYLIKTYGKFNLKSLGYSKENSDDMNFIDKIAAMRNMNPKI